MKLDMTNQMRMEQRMKLAPRMIQSMEILQLSTLALLEKIETELNSNPVLEAEESPENMPAPGESQEQQQEKEGKEAIHEPTKSEKEFNRIDDFAQGADDYYYRTEISRSDGDEPDKKLEAMNNTPDSGLSLNDYLLDQWRLVDADEKVKKAGEQIIDYIDEKGYLKVRLEQLYNKDKNDFSLEDLEKAMKLIHELEPAGVGARDVKECLLIQMKQSAEDMSFEIDLVSNHLDKLLENKLPEIAKKMNCSVERINQAIMRMRKFDTSPGLQISKTKNPPIKADILVEPVSGGFKVSLADKSIPSLRINEYYSNMAKDRKLDTKTRQFLNDNIRSAKWLMDAITQRKHTLLKVSRTVVDSQSEFFEKGKMYLKPLPMSEVADKIGVHVATVSRAVAGKYIQSPQGLMPLRDLFGGGMESSNGGSESFEAIRAKMQQVIDSEDKSKPLSDDAIKTKLEELGVKDIARRTVAKYRKIMKIPTARFRKKF